MTPIGPIEPGATGAAADAIHHTRDSDKPSKALPAEIDSETVRTAVDTTQQVVFGTRSIEFAYIEDTDRVVITVRSTETGEVVRQIPPEEYLRFVEHARELLGVVDEVA